MSASGIPLEFVQVSGQPNDTSWRKQVRAHAAKNPKARRQRVLKYQNERAREMERTSQLVRDDPEISIVMPINPQSILGAWRRDPFQSFVRPLSPFEGFLFDHCTYSCFVMFPLEAV